MTNLRLDFEARLSWYTEKIAERVSVLPEDDRCVVLDQASDRLQHQISAAPDSRSTHAVTKMHAVTNFVWADQCIVPVHTVRHWLFGQLQSLSPEQIFTLHEVLRHVLALLRQKF